ncbi:MAG TPA: hypothetical protein VFV08_16615, partial [Puia sp.]|nr:hypothetical protein [Puia sp.]
FISSKIEGRRNNGMRHPHSWNIVDEPELVTWIKDKLHFYPDHLAKPYEYIAPKSWNHEIIMFPMDFAPSIPYKGFEDLRFAPGWNDPNSPDRYAYSMLWWLDGVYQFNESILTKDLESYYTGITKRRAIAEKLDMNAWKPAKVQIQKINTSKGDRETYTAHADIFDSWVARKPGTIYLKIHVKDCPDKTRTLVLTEIAGYPYSASSWQALDKINEDFQCEKNP